MTAKDLLFLDCDKTGYNLEPKSSFATIQLNPLAHPPSLPPSTTLHTSIHSLALHLNHLAFAALGALLELRDSVSAGFYQVLASFLVTFCPKDRPAL